MLCAGFAASQGKMGFAAAIAVGVSGVFMETHPDPARALSDGPNAWPLPKLEALLRVLIDIDQTVKRSGFAEQAL